MKKLLVCIFALFVIMSCDITGSGSDSNDDSNTPSTDIEDTVKDSNDDSNTPSTDIEDEVKDSNKETDGSDISRLNGTWSRKYTDDGKNLEDFYVMENGKYSFYTKEVNTGKTKNYMKGNYTVDGTYMTIRPTHYSVNDIRYYNYNDKKDYNDLKNMFIAFEWGEEKLQAMFSQKTAYPIGSSSFKIGSDVYIRN